MRLSAELRAVRGRLGHARPMSAGKMTWRRLVGSACQALGGIDVLINNAGIAWREPFLEDHPGSLGSRDRP